ncbi:hypothetical protein NLI96_g7213 [Meripilus lineatus]|uniref:Uncharacterized protein n=1 Tax=Meripilus lineatus TaxID=2056292 RepID=A0AAD5YF80_9APHY|nr:hypothetical protein NLI96_g7213 [Physisporinus lineatus]
MEDTRDHTQVIQNIEETVGGSGASISHEGAKEGDIQKHDENVSTQTSTDSSNDDGDEVSDGDGDENYDDWVSKGPNNKPVVRIDPKRPSDSKKTTKPSDPKAVKKPGEPSGKK